MERNTLGVKLLNETALCGSETKQTYAIVPPKASLADLSQIKSDVEYLEFLKQTKLKFTLRGSHYKAQQLGYYELLNYTCSLMPSGRAANIRVILRHTFVLVPVIDKRKTEDVTVSTSTILMSWSRAMKQGINLLFDESRHEGCQAIMEQIERDNA